MWADDVVISVAEATWRIHRRVTLGNKRAKRINVGTILSDLSLSLSLSLSRMSASRNANLWSARDTASCRLLDSTREELAGRALHGSLR